MGRGSAGLYNFISVFFLLATVIALVIFGVLFTQDPASRGGGEPVDAALLPTTAALPTATPTRRLPPTLPPTFTPTPTHTETPTQTSTPTPTPTLTLTASQTPSVTPTLAATFTPSASPTDAPTATPTGPTATYTPSLSPFLFRLREPVQYVQNFANAAGCNWQGVGGQVVGLDGTQYSRGNLQVRVFNDVFDRTAPVGSNSLYGEISGYEVQVGNQIDTTAYFVQLETINGTAVSDRIQVRFRASCAGNVATVNFIQQRQF